MDQENTASIQDKLRQAWSQERRYIHLRGASRLAIWLIAMVVISFLLDWGLLSRTGMHGSFGVLLLLINVCVLCWVLWHEWLRYLRPFDPVLVALDVEERHPHLSSLLVSYVQLESPAQDQPNVSVELIVAMRDQAVATARPFDFRDIVDFRQLKNLLLVALGVLLLFGALSIRWGDHLSTLLYRLVGVNQDYPTETRVTRVTKNVIVRIGDTASISARAADVIPEQGKIFTRKASDEEGDWKELPMKRIAGSEPTFARELRDLTEDLDYYVQLGDGKSPEYRIRVIQSPRVTNVSIQQKFPPYLKKADLPGNQLNMEVPEGTEIFWRLTCDQAVKEFVVETDREEGGLSIPAETDKTKKEETRQSIQTEIDETGKILTFTTTADKAFRYSFRWTEDESGKDFEFDDVEYAVRVVADTAPEVELSRPRTNLLATVKKKLKVEARATDDHGLGQAWLVYSHDGGEEKRVPIIDFGAAPGKKFDYEWELEKAIEGLKIGSEVIFSIEVSDHYPEEQDHWRRSATRRLTIVDPERYLEWYRTELAAQNEELKRSRAAEKLSSDKVKDIKNQEAESE